jgi:hypothetical protein
MLALQSRQRKATYLARNLGGTFGLTAEDIIVLSVPHTSLMRTGTVNLTQAKRTVPTRSRSDQVLLRSFFSEVVTHDDLAAQGFQCVQAFS